jgi:Leucine-rich repeat (LRR) protein
LSNNQLKTLPDTIGCLVNLCILNLSNGKLESLPDTISNLINLQELNLLDNRLKSLPFVISKIKNTLLINESSYQINNLDMETKILIFFKLDKQLKNLPTTLKEIWIKTDCCADHRLPFGCELKYY